MSDLVETGVWLRPDQADFVRALADLAGLKISVAGSPDHRTGTAAADALGADFAGDIRALLRGSPPKLMLLADPGDLGEIRGDAEAVLNAAADGCRIVSLAPVPASAIELQNNGWTKAKAGREPYRGITQLYRPTTTKLWRTTRDMLEHFGPVRSAAIGVALPAAAGSLGSLMIGALELAIEIVGECETVYAAHAPSVSGGGLHAVPGDTLRNLTGDAHATLRGSGTLCTLRLTSGAPRPTLVARFDGPEGAIVAFDDAIGWWGPDGAERDRSTDLGTESLDAAEGISAAIRRTLKPGGISSPIDTIHLLTVAQAALLSMTTGQAERPDMVGRIVRSA
ncbi:MAG: hypothetical protein AAGB51_01785 [Planctomycetota bacterium]